MRRLLALTTSLMFLELVFFTVLSPLLPDLKHQLGLSTSQAGVLVATYAVGCAVGAIPALMIVVRLGVRTTALVSLATFAAMSVAFGLADGYDALLVTPRNSRALSHAIERMIEDNRMRQALIRNGFAAARRQTLDHFVVTVRRELECQTKTASAAVPQA